MQTTKAGDRVLVHFVKRFEDGAEASSRSHGGEPLEVIVGTPHARLPGVDRVLMKLSPGQEVFVSVPPGTAFRAPDPSRVVQVSRDRFPAGRSLKVGSRVRLAGRSGRVRLVRVVKANDKVVVVDTNHRRAGEGIELEIELVAIVASNSVPVVS